MNIRDLFKTREQKEIESLTKRLVDTILKRDSLKQLIIDAKKQWEFEELQAQKLSYPIIQDLINTAQHGIVIDVRMADGGSFVLRTDPNLTVNAQEQAEKARRANEKEVW